MAVVFFVSFSMNKAETLLATAALAVVFVLMKIFARSFIARRRYEFHLIAVAFACLALFSLFIYNYTVTTDRDCGAVGAGLSPIYSRTECAKIGSKSARSRCLDYTKNPYDAVSTGNGLAVAYTGVERGLLLIPSEKSRPPLFHRFYSKERGPIRLHFDPSSKILAGGLVRGKTVYFFNTAPFKILKMAPIPWDNIADIDYYDGNYYVLSENQVFYVIDNRR
ncbi:MAG TPA: hypothetical protein PLQ76_06795, partial [bacterium]|nr:hypothetical protein [bacterium]